MGSRLWQGLPRGKAESVAVLGHVTTLLPTPLGLLLVSDGLLLHCKGDSSPSPISCTNDLALVKGVAAVEEDKVLVLLADGEICQVDLKAQTLSSLPQFPHPTLLTGIFSLPSSPSTTFLLDRDGRLYSKGKPPLSGNVVEKTKDWSRVTFLEQMEVVQLVSGEDFTVVLAKEGGEAVFTPEEESVKKIISCPLGLAVESEPQEEVSYKAQTLDELSDHVDNGSTFDDKTVSINEFKPDYHNPSIEKCHSSLEQNFEAVALSEEKVETLSDVLTSGNDTDPYDDLNDKIISTTNNPIKLDISTNNPVELDISTNNLVELELTANNQAQLELTNFSEEKLEKDEVEDLSLSRLNFVTDLGKTVWSSSLSLLSLSKSEETSCPSQGLVRKQGVKSSSEPPTYRPDVDTGPRALHKSCSLSLVSIKLDQRGASLESLSKLGEQLASWQVYCWGNNKRGQLGQGDMLTRPAPTLVTFPPQTILVKLSAGSHHCLALGDTGQVWGWGDNSKGQAVSSDPLAVVLHPTQVRLPAGETARDISCSAAASLILTMSGDLIVTGRAGQDNKARLQVVPALQLHLPPGEQAMSVRMAGGHILVSSGPVHPATLGLMMQERKMLSQSRSVSSVMTALITSDNTDVHQGLISVKDKVAKLTNLLTQCSSISRLITTLSLSSSMTTGFYIHITQVMAILASVNTAVCDCIAVDCLMLDSHHFVSIQPAVVETLSEQFEVSSSTSDGQQGLEQLLLQVAKLLPSYLTCLMKVHSGLQEQEVPSPPGLWDKILGLTGQVKAMEREQHEAVRTRLFWQSAGPRLERLQGEVGRRLVLDNRTQPISLQGKYSRHWLVLFSDLLVDVGSYSSVLTYSLATVWLDVIPAPSLQIQLTTPEESLTLAAPDSEQRTVWVQALQRCILSTLSNFRDDRESYSVAPVSRTAAYTFNRGESKGANYQGGWLHGKMHGKGRMEYPDGSVHVGQWRGGERHGRGVTVLCQGRGGGRQEGLWVRGKLEGKGRLVDNLGSVYEGSLQDGLPHGHGTKKEGKFTGTKGASVYIGDWVKGVRHGYGVLEDIMAGEKYMGQWVDGLKQGKGCVVNSDGVYYEGNFLNDRLCGGGLMIFEDGASYLGDFAGAGEFNGKGVLVAGGKKFTGTFTGNYGERMKFNGEIINLAPGEDENDGVASGGRHTVDPDMKWVSVFSSLPGLQEVEGGNRQVWENVAIAINLAKTQAREEGVPLLPGLDYLETIPAAGQDGHLDTSQLNEVKSYLAEATSCPQHPLKCLVDQVVESFIASYGGVRSHPTLLPHATAELHSLTARLYTIVRTLFPTLPSQGEQLWVSGEEQQESIMVTHSSLLFPILLPPLHPTVFMLYALREQKSDSVYWERILRWNKHPDKTLLIFLEVDPRFHYADISHQARDRHFTSAIHSLQQLKTTFSPQNKLSVVVDMFRAITSSEEQVTWSMDALLPVCMYVVVRARVLQLGAELSMLQDLMETFLFQGEQGIMLTTLLAAYHQIKRENVFIN